MQGCPQVWETPKFDLLKIILLRVISASSSLKNNWQLWMRYCDTESVDFFDYLIEFVYAYPY